jgi:RNA polymerase sigma factor (sigma-70 family)
MSEHPVGPVALRAELARLLSPGSDFHKQMREKAERLARVTGSKDAEDLLQDLCLKLVKVSGEYRPEKGSLAAFLAAVAAKWYAATARTIKRRRRSVSLDSLAEVGVFFECVDTSLDRAGLDAVLDAMDVEAVLPHIPFHLRDLVLLLGDRSLAEIAELSGEHRTTVWRRLQELKAAVAKILGQNRN